jgi:aminopeptidase YwaD
MRRRFILLWVLIVPGVHFAGAQAVADFSDSAVVSRLRQDVYSLASEEMEGREAGTRGERLAAHYIKLQMQEAGLAPLFDTTYFQSFTFPGEWVWGSNNQLSVGNASFVHEQHFYTLPGSGSGIISGKWIDAGCGDDIQGLYAQGLSLREKIWVMEYSPCSDKPSVDGAQRKSSRNQRLTAAVQEGAKAVIFVDRSSEREEPSIDLRFTGRNYDIPVVFAGKELKEHLFNKPNTEVVLSADIARGYKESVNVAGYIDNQAATTVVIGGHFDHIGFGGQASREPGVHSIHYGADDNASGVAGMLEAARYFSQPLSTGNNYLFIAFGAEEKGLLGSHYFVNSDVYEVERINYMFNLDMIGRMENNNLVLIGTGTSPLWDALIDEHAPPHLDVRRSLSGVGGSDHTNFYVQQIPVLFFFTGIHEDYHRTSDTPDKINYSGMKEVLGMMYDMISGLDDREKLAFTPTATQTQTSRRSESVSLGVMPDHTFEEGFRIQAVIENRPAFQAGLQGGDVILRINSVEVHDIYGYMEALKSLKEGSKAIIVVLREGRELPVEVQL